MARLLAFPAGRRTKWLVLAGGLLVLVVAGSFAGKFDSVQKNEPVSYLPGKAESVKALKQVEKFPSGQTLQAIVVFHRDGGLTRTDLETIARDRASLLRR